MSRFYHAFPYKVQRISRRTFSSVIQPVNVKDFTVKNEPILSYLEGSSERNLLKQTLGQKSGTVEDIPIVIGDEEYRTSDVRYQVMPHNHQKRIAKFYYAGPDLINKAIETARDAQLKWEEVPSGEKIDIWLRAADLMANQYRMELNATTMLGQSKTVIQAEIDSAAELIDFFRFNAFFAKELFKYQPISDNPKVTLNSMRYRGVDGFVAAVSPFNFTAIGGNLAYTPALMGCAVLWKPSDTALLSNWTIFKIMKEAGLPSGVVNFIPADGPVFGDAITNSPLLAGINFTGSVPTFNRLWSQVGRNIQIYHNFPRLIGECGGKNYHFVHPSADVLSVINGTVKSAFEYCGQKCSACSRLYVPESLWPKVKEGLIDVRNTFKIGDVSEFDSFASAVIDKKAFDRITGYIEYAKVSSNLKIIAGGSYDDSRGYYIQPTIIQTTDPTDKIMTEEIFGPIVAVYVYKDNAIQQTLELLKTTTPYALTGAVFAHDRTFLVDTLRSLKYSAGNFYINDKSTGSVVGQQPFGGGRLSGTNDKAGGPHYVLRWSTPQSIKETFVPLTEITYAYMK